MKQQKNECKCCTQLRKDIQILIKEVRQLKRTCSRMDGHISSVENVYNVVRRPLGYFLGGVNYMLNRNELPEIESSQESNQQE